MTRNKNKGKAAALATPEQQAFFKKHGTRVNFRLNVNDDPKDQFPVLAALLGWVEGCDRWKSHWRTCFSEKYIMPVSGDSITDKFSALSINSSNYSSRTATSDSSSIGVSLGVWDSFADFTPYPTAPFQQEFTRLAASQGWSKKEKKRQRIAIFAADFEAHQGDYINNVRAWQDLCRLCGIDPVPDSITKCKKALKIIYVNIFHVLDAQRTSTKCKVFESYSAFAKFTRKSSYRFPLKDAKEDTFLKIFLKQL